MTIYIVCWDASDYGSATWEYKEAFKTRKEAETFIKEDATDYSLPVWEGSAMYNFDEAGECYKIIEKTL